MHRGATQSSGGVTLMSATIAITGLYLAGRVLLPAAGHAAVDAWRLAVGVPVFALAAFVVLREARRTEASRLPWSLLAAGIAIYPVGTVLTAVYGSALSAPPIAHAAWLTFYLCAYLALAGFAHAALRPFPSAFLLDGVAVVLTLGSVVALAAAAGGAAPYRLWEAALGLSYPALDLVLLGYTTWIVAVAPRPTALLWRRLLGAWALLLICDLMFVAFGAARELSDIAIYTAGYPVVMVLLARAAAAPMPTPTPLRLDTRTAIVIPALSMAVLLGVLAVVAIQPTDGPAVPLVAAALLVLTARVVLIHRVAARLAEARRFEQGFDEAGIGMGISDISGRWIRVNPALAAMLGAAPDELVGRDAFAQVEGEHRTVRDALRAQLSHGNRTVDPVHLRVSVPGDTRDLLVTGDLVEDPDGPRCFVQVRDVTVERRIKRHADAVSAISRQALALDDLDELVARVMPQLADATGADLVAWVPIDAATSAVTCPEPSMLGSRVMDDLRAGGAILLGARDGRGVEISDPRALELGLPNLHQLGMEHVAFTPVQPRAAARAVLCVAHRHAPARTSDERTFTDTVANVLATAADRAHDERASRHRALHDPLTGLANRALLTAHLSQAIAAARRDDASVGTLLIDLDRFKLVNDTLGHEIGDGLLRAVSERLARHTRDGDLLARLGGDEFALVVSRVADPRDVERAATRIVQAMEAPFAVGGRDLSVGASAGVAILPAAVATPAALLREADAAMYRAKRAGGARWSRADGAVRGRVEARGELERELRSAVHTDRLRLALQPQISLGAEHLVCFEALVRWARPGQGLVLPDGFLPAAATIGALPDIGEWVMHRAAEFAAMVTDAAAVPPCVAINLLPAQLVASLPEAIDHACTEHGVSASRLQVEVPAALVVTDESAMGIAQRLRARGVGVVLEDFGTGWTSLMALHRSPVDALKLDRALVARLPDSASARSVARSTVRLADELGVPVIAPGIEHAAQLAAVRELGIDLVQGHLIGPPVSGDDAAGYLRARAWESALAG